MPELESSSQESSDFSLPAMNNLRSQAAMVERCKGSAELFNIWTKVNKTAVSIPCDCAYLDLQAQALHILI